MDDLTQRYPDVWIGTATATVAHRSLTVTDVPLNDGAGNDAGHPIDAIVALET